MALSLLVGDGPEADLPIRESAPQPSSLDSPLYFVRQSWTDILAEALVGTETASGIQVNEEKALAYGTVWACARVLCETLGSIPLKVYRKTTDGGREEARDHPLWRTLHQRPNGEMTPRDWKKIAMLYLVLWGNAYSQIVRNRRGDIELWPLRADWMEIKRRGDSLLYVYRLPDGSKRGFPAEEIWHIRGMSLDGVKGLSVIGQARETVGKAMVRDEFGARFFRNDSQPNFLLKGDFKTEEAAQQFRERWEFQHSGPRNAGKTAIVPSSFGVERLGVPLADAQFLELGKFDVESIARIFRMPVHMIQLLDRMSFNNIENLDIGFVKYTMADYLIAFEEGADHALLDETDARDGIYTQFVTDSLTRGDIATRYEAHSRGIQTGFLLRNEARRLENLPPIEGGDIPLVPVNLMPSEELGMAAKMDQEGESNDERTGRSFHVERRANAARLRLRLRKSYRPILRDAAQRVLKREIADVRKAAKALSDGTATGQKRFAEWIVDYYRAGSTFGAFLEKRWKPVLHSFADAIAEAARAEIDSDRAARQVPGSQAEAGNDNLDAFLRAYLDALVTRWSVSSRGQLEKVLEEATASEIGNPADAIDARLTHWEEGEGETRSRDERIAFRESVQAEGGVSRYVWAGAGVSALVWQTQGDSCPFCNRLAGQRVGIADAFLHAGDAVEGGDGDTPIRVSGNLTTPGLHDGCDCYIVPG